MNYRYLALPSVLAGMFVLGASVPMTGQEGASLRTPWGAPDLQGIWHVMVDVPLERHAKYAGREFLTDEEVKALDEAKAKDPGKDASREVDLAYNAVFNSITQTGKRTSLIVDPRDGKIPPLTPEGQKRLAAARAAEPQEAYETARLREHGAAAYNPTEYDNPETIPMNTTRCVVAGGPDIPRPGQPFRLVQSPKAVAIYIENSGSRVISLDGSSHVAPHIRPVLGDSRGRWEGDSLVVETTNFKRMGGFRTLTFKAANPQTFRMSERFTRVDANQLRREVTFADPDTWTRPWTVLIELGRSADQRNLIFESACHEGNYGMTGILAGVRAEEKAEAAKQRSVR